MAKSFAEVIPPHNHIFCSLLSGPNVDVFFRSRTMLLEKKDMLKTWQTEMSPVVSRHMSVESFVEDIASPFLHILSPLSLRPVSCAKLYLEINLLVYYL